MEIIARYVAIGRRCFQCQVVVEPCRLREARSPLPATSRSLGTFTATSKVALSRGRVVVREPGHRTDRFAQHRCAVGGRDPAVQCAVGIDVGLRLPAVRDRGREGPPDRSRRGDLQLVPAPTPRCPVPVHRHRADGEALQIEGVGGQPLRRLRLDRRGRADRAAAAVVRQPDPVVHHVVPAVSRVGEQRVACRRRPGPGGGRGNRRGRAHRPAPEAALRCRRTDQPHTGREHADHRQTQARPEPSYSSEASSDPRRR